MSGKATSTSAWLKFFRGAGIPAGIDTKYALLFDENRIKMDMLMDLDKEILKDMGIVAMGDIISILKYSRKVHDETKEQAVETNKPTQSQSLSSSPASGKLTPESTMQPSPKVVPKSSVVVSSKPESKSATGEASSVTKVKSVSLPHQSIRMMERHVGQSKLVTETVQRPVDQRAETTERKMIVLNKRSIAESPLREEVPLQKKIRVLPEHEGKYKIKMPDGLIPRTQKVIQNRLGPSLSELSSAKDKKNVFERLGESNVSSSTEDKQPLSSSTSTSRLESSKDNFSKMSVFERLGDRGRLGDSSKTPATLISTVTKPLIQTKVDLSQQNSTVPPKSRYDPKVYMEKTLMTIPSRISIPYMTKTRLKSEIIAPAASTSTSTTRIISSKPSASSSQSQTKIMVGHKMEVIHKERSEREERLGRTEEYTKENKEIKPVLAYHSEVKVQRISTQGAGLQDKPPSSKASKVDVIFKEENSTKQAFIEKNSPPAKHQSEVLSPKLLGSHIRPAEAKVKMRSTVFKPNESTKSKARSPDKISRQNYERESKHLHPERAKIKDCNWKESSHHKRHVSNRNERRVSHEKSTKPFSESEQRVKEIHISGSKANHSAVRQGRHEGSSKRRRSLSKESDGKRHPKKKRERRTRSVERNRKYETPKREQSSSDSDSDSDKAGNKVSRINAKFRSERERVYNQDLHQFSAKREDGQKEKVSRAQSQEKPQVNFGEKYKKKAPSTTTSQPSPRELMSEQRVIYEDRSNLSQLPQASKDSKTEQVVKFQINPDPGGLLGLNLGSYEKIETITSHMTEKPFKPTYYIINEKYGALAGATQSSKNKVHMSQNYEGVVSKKSMSIPLSPDSSKYECNSITRSKTENDSTLRDEPTTTEKFNDRASGYVKHSKSKDSGTPVCESHDDRKKSHQEKGLEKESNQNHTHVSKNDRTLTSEKLKYSAHRAEFDYNNTFVREKNFVEHNLCGEEIIRIARPPSDNDRYIPDNKSMKMMSKMGWCPGRGLGKHNQGRKAAVESGQSRLNNAGLGFGRK